MEQTELIRYTLATLDTLAIPHMLVGSFASTTYGEIRFTQDIDIVIDLAAENIEAFCRIYPPPEFYLSEPAIRDAVRTRFQFNVLHTATGNKIDFMFPRNNDWGREQLARRRKLQILPQFYGYAASPEDVIIGKLWYHDEGGSDKHLRDIAGMLKISGTSIDRSNIEYWVRHLGFTKSWNAILETVDKHQPGER